MESPEIQRRVNREWAARLGHTLVTEVTDPDATGRNFNRDVQRAIEMVETGQADGILVYKFSRFGRDNAGFQMNLGRIIKAGGDLYSSTEEVDATTAAGALSRDMLAAIASFESNRFSEQWKDSQDLRLDRGLPHTGDPRFGYIHHKCRSQAVTAAGWRIRNAKDPECRPHGDCREEYRIDPETGPVLAEMYKRYIKGQSLVDIANWLIEEGVPTTRDGVWRASLVGDLLDSGFGAGRLRTGGRGLPSDNNTVELHQGAQEAVIKPKEWSQYMARRRDRRGNQSAVRMKWPLSGITVCGRCGNGMTCTTGGPSGQQIRGYIMRCIKAQDSKTCKGVWRVTRDVEEALLGELDALAAELEAAGRRAARTVREQRTDQSARMRRVQADLKKARDGRRRLMDALVAGVYTLDEVAEKRAELDQKVAALEVEMSGAEAPVRVWTPPQIRSLRQDWPRLPLDARREMVRLLVDKIIVHPDKRIEVFLSPALTGKAAA
ncbi:recombinase family protein [Nocardioides euryhalodurans]|nr:recombinase family protein [Nocardioides euryhalodurans]